MKHNAEMVWGHGKRIELYEKKSHLHCGSTMVEGIFICEDVSRRLHEVEESCLGDGETK